MLQVPLLGRQRQHLRAARSRRSVPHVPKAARVADGGGIGDHVAAAEVQVLALVGSEQDVLADAVLKFGDLHRGAFGTDASWRIGRHDLGPQEGEPSGKVADDEQDRQQKQGREQDGRSVPAVPPLAAGGGGFIARDSVAQEGGAQQLFRLPGDPETVEVFAADDGRRGELHGQVLRQRHRLQIHQDHGFSLRYRVMDLPDAVLGAKEPGGEEEHHGSGVAEMGCHHLRPVGPGLDAPVVPQAVPVRPQSADDGQDPIRVSVGVADEPVGRGAGIGGIRYDLGAAHIYLRPGVP